MATHKKRIELARAISLVRVTRTLYFFIAVFALSIVIFDSGNLITKDAVVDRWTALTILLVINTAVWYAASQKNKNTSQLALLLLSTAVLIFAGFMTYWERGMASSSTILYMLPLLLVATLRNRHALLAMAALAAGTYAFATVKYFNDFFNEGYRVQLWGNIVLYAGSIFVVTWLIMILAGLRHDSE
jgi:hypothetical protein